MKRLGFFTGKIYGEEDFNTDSIRECCLSITDSQAEDTEYIVDKYAACHSNCYGCYGCPEGQSALL